MRKALKLVGLVLMVYGGFFLAMILLYALLPSTPANIRMVILVFPFLVILLVGVFFRRRLKGYAEVVLVSFGAIGVLMLPAQIREIKTQRLFSEPKTIETASGAAVKSPPIAHQLGSSRDEASPPILDLDRDDNGTGPWLILKNPFRRRGEMLIMALRPIMMSAGESFRFNRMISQDTALFDYQGGTYQEYLTGQIAVIVDPSRGMEIGPAPNADWKIEPLGTLAGTNGFGAPIQVPLIKFWGYCTPVYGKPGKWPPCKEDIQTKP